MTATDELRRLLDERGTMYKEDAFNLLADQGEIKETVWRIGDSRCVFHEYRGKTDLSATSITPEQAITATLGRPKAKAHPYGYEPDTGAFDATRCECGCINDISARYCNDCGGEIEIDMKAEKELCEHQHRVFVIKHDDGSLEFCEKRYIAATLGSG